MHYFGLSLLTGLLLILTFPRFDVVWLAPIALAPLLIAAAKERRGFRRFLYGELAGVVYWAGVCYWVQFVLSYHGGMGEFGSWGAFSLFCFAKALHLAVFTWLAGYLVNKPYAIPAVAALWVGIERTHGPLGFAWLTLGNAGIDLDILARLAPWTGVYGLSFVFAMVATAFAGVALRRSRRELLWLGVLLGLFLLPNVPRTEPVNEEAVVVQSNIDVNKITTPNYMRDLSRRLIQRSIDSAIDPERPRPELIIWPEVPAPFYYDLDRQFRSEAHRLARATATPFLFGTVVYNSEGAPLNSALLLSPEGEPLVRYDKMFLVPFGEFIPPFFGWVNKITKEPADFTPGTELRLMPIRDRRVGTFICYESVFPHLVRRFVESGAEVLVNMTNDGYFGGSAAREQHLLIARMRAVENQRWLLRVANDGVTAAIDPAGAIVQRLEEFTETAERFGYRYENLKTFYTRHGDWFAWLCLLASLAICAIVCFPRR